MEWEVILLVGGVLAIVGVVAYVQHARELKRTERLRDLASSLGLEFSPVPDRTLASKFEPFTLFKTGRNRIAWNILSGGTAEEQLTLFDYRYTVGSGKQQHTHKRTVVCFESAVLDLPQFELRPETFFDKITQMFGKAEINLDDYPEFSKRYYLTGSTEQVRDLFSEPLVRKFESLRDVCASGYKQRLIFYRNSNRATVENFRSLMEDAYSVYALMKRDSPSGAVPQ